MKNRYEEVKAMTEKMREIAIKNGRIEDFEKNNMIVRKNLNAAIKYGVFQQLLKASKGTNNEE